MAVCHANVTEVRIGGLVAQRVHGPHQWVLEKRNRWQTHGISGGFIQHNFAEYYCSSCLKTKKDDKSVFHPAVDDYIRMGDITYAVPKGENFS